MLSFTKSRFSGKRLLTLSVLLFTMVFTYTTIAQEMGAIRRSVEYSFPEKIQKLVLDPLPAGTYSIGTGGYFPTIDSAFNKLSIDGIEGEVNLELIDNLYTAPSVQFGFVLNGPIPGAGPNSRVTIKPAENKNVTIEGNNEGLLYFINTSYVTIDGIDLTGSTTLTIHTLQTPFPYNDTIDFMNNSDHNIVQNVTFISEDSGFGPSFFPDYPAGSLFAPDSNLIQNNFIKKGGVAIYVSAEFSAVEAIGNIIRGNIVGSETDSLISWGIQAQFTRNTIIENNIVHSLRGDILQGWQTVRPGINSYFGSGDIIRNNIVHSLRFDTGITSVGILLSGSSNERGSNNQVYNNMIYDIQSTSTQTTSILAGIEIWHQDNPKIYYNSVYLSGTGNGANPSGSAAFYIYGGFGACTGVDVKDNIFVNTRDESPYWASSIYDHTASNLTSDYNDLYYEPNQYNALVRIGSTNYNTLADWQATGKDLNSVTEMPNFVDPYLHIDETIPTNIDSGATPIAGIDTDFDGELRNVSTPDIGADEFTIMPTPTLTVVSPNGGEVWIVDETEDITWISEYVTDVMIELSIDNGTTWSSIVDSTPSTGTYSWEVAAQDSSDQCLIKVTDISDGNINDESDAVFTIDIISSVNDNDEGIPTVYALEQNFPNPFNPSTKIKYSVPQSSNVVIKVFDILGNEIAVLMDEEKSVGTYKLNWNASNLPSGVYFY